MDTRRNLAFIADCSRMKGPGEMRGHDPEEMRRRLVAFFERAQGRVFIPARRMTPLETQSTKATILPFPGRRRSLAALAPSLSTDD